MSDLRVFPGWRDEPALLPALCSLFTFAGEDRASGYLYSEGEQPWPAALEQLGPALLDDVSAFLDTKFTVALFQAYRDGSGCDWHADTPFDAQAVLSLGVTRTFGVRPNGGEPEWIRVAHGDLVFMPPGFQTGWEHSVPVEDVPGERCSLVFRTVVRG